MKINISKRILWLIGSNFLLFIEYILCRYILIDLHGMYEWPRAIYIFGIIVIIIAAIFDRRKIMLCTVSGFIAGFTLGALFNVDGFDNGGGTTNNFWIWWTLTMVNIIFIGIIWEIVLKRIKEHKWAGTPGTKQN